MSLSLAERTCWIFDMDGTLTVGIHDFNAIKVALDLPIDQPILESLAQLSAAESVSKQQKLSEIELGLAFRATAQAGAYALLERLQAQGKRLGILTRNGKQMAYETLAACGLLNFFEPDHILSRDCCAPKPQPDGIFKLLTLWNADQTEAVMVGDYMFDLVAGRQAGAATVYLDPTGEFPWKEHADHQIESLTCLLEMICLGAAIDPRQ